MVYACADLHGLPLCEFKKLLQKANFSNNDTLYIIGDIIDRGEHGIELLKWAMAQPNVYFILGNHEAMFLVCSFIFEEITDDFIWNLSYDKLKLVSSWLNNGGGPTLKALQNSKSDIEDIIEYLKDAPLYECVSAGGKDFILVHSGFENFDNNKKLTDYSADELLWHRPSINEEFYSEFITVLGHTPTELYGEQFANKILKTKTWINIDTGEKPSLLRLDDLKEFYL